MAEEEEAAVKAEEEAEKEEEQQEEQVEAEDEVRSVSSSMVAEVGYEREAEEVVVVFVNGHEDSYPCTPDQWSALLDAPSVGKFFWENFL
jgi:hypothetical protein